MWKTGITGALGTSLRSWGRRDTVIMWVWPVCIAGAVTVSEIFWNNQSQHPGGKFWIDRVPGYFTATLAFTGIILAISKLLPRLEGWIGILLASAIACTIIAVVVPGNVDWWDRLRLERNLVLLTTLYLVPPFLLATVVRRLKRTAD